MFEYVKYRWKLSELQKARQSVVSKAPRPVEGEEYAADFSTEIEIEIVEHKIYRLLSDYFYEKAFRYGVPVPSGDEYWQDSEAYPGTQHLNPKGLSVLRASIHEEKKRRLEYFSILGAGLTGLVGAVTGLVAVLTKHS